MITKALDYWYDPADKGPGQPRESVRPTDAPQIITCLKMAAS